MANANLQRINLVNGGYTIKTERIARDDGTEAFKAWAQVGKEELGAAIKPTEQAAIIAVQQNVIKGIWGQA